MADAELLRHLKSEVAECRLEAAVLRDCLATLGVLDKTKFFIQYHRRRFARICVVYGQPSGAKLDTAIDVRAVALTAGTFAGPTAMRTLREVSRGVLPAVTDIIGSLCPGKVYVCGGFEPPMALSSVERLDPASRVWEVLTPMVEARQYTCAGVVSSRIFVCGGWGGPQPVNTVESYDPHVGSWEAMPPMLVARWGAAAGVVDGRLHICGGLDEGRQPLSSVERFTPPSASHRWLGTSRGGGGENYWEAVPAMAEPRGWPAASVLGGYLYVCGGRDEQREPLSSAERLGPSGRVWDALPRMSEQRAGAGAAAAAGRLYVAGGAFGSQMLRSAERYDPWAGAWEALPAMQSRRAYVAAASIAGCLHVFGGSDGSQCLDSAEEFCPVRGTWLPLLPMSERRSGAAAVSVMD